MARGTANTPSTKATGNPLPAAQVNAYSSLISSSDDDTLYELFALDPPAGATSTNVNTGLAFLNDGPGVVGDAARNVTVKPVRVARSATSVSTPRAILSAATQVDTLVALPAAPGGATWGLLLVYAQITYVDASDPSKGSLVSFFVQEPTYGTTAAAPPVATLPAHTSTTWNVPIRYVKSFTGQAAIANEDILEYPDSIAEATAGHRALRITGKLRGLDARRAYSSANNAPSTLGTGGTSFYVGGTSPPRGKDQILTTTVTPVAVGRHDGEVVFREILIPGSTGGAGNGCTGGTGGVAQTWVVDDTRDWRGANVKTEWWVPQDAATCFAEEDPSAVGGRKYPAMLTTGGGSAKHEVVGQTWVAATPHATFGSQLWAATVSVDADIPGTGTRNGVANGFLVAGDGWGLYADAATGALTFYAKVAGTGSGPPVWILLSACFSNHRP